MAYEQEPNTGVLFIDDIKKLQSKDGRDFYVCSGSINIDGVDYFLDGYVNKAKTTGKKYLRLKVKKKDKQAGAPATEMQVLTIDEDV